jgi:hypothetical protein
MHRGKSVPKLTFENGRDRAAAILEDMVVNDQEARWRNREPEIHLHSFTI